MIRLIDVREARNQNIVVKEPAKKDEIILENVKDQSILVSGKTEIIEIPIENTSPIQKITIGIPSNPSSDITIALAGKVPKALSVLSPISEMEFNTLGKRKASRVYVDANGEPKYATIEQIKALNTKTLYVDALNDERISELSNDDIILLNEG